ncbi:MAG: nitroreductase family protein [Myxococcota bacterium]
MMNNCSNSIIDNLIKISNQKTDNLREISDEEILTLIKAARLAPSADNSQISRFLILHNEAIRERLLSEILKTSKKYNRVIVALAAPFIIRHIRREQPFYAIDVPIAISHIMLQGLELGIKTDLFFVFENREIESLLNIPEKYKLVAVMGLNRYANK